jgi:hypothetical protein
MRSAVQSAKHVVGQINNRVPRTLGESLVHISQFDSIFREVRRGNDRCFTSAPAQAVCWTGPRHLRARGGGAVRRGDGHREVRV